eukprot:scaffold91094_cov75-Cyclotella_meneghiniana.AAC.2
MTLTALASQSKDVPVWGLILSDLSTRVENRGQGRTQPLEARDVVCLLKIKLNLNGFESGERHQSHHTERKKKVESGRGGARTMATKW